MSMLRTAPAVEDRSRLVQPWSAIVGRALKGFGPRRRRGGSRRVRSLSEWEALEARTVLNGDLAGMGAPPPPPPAGGETQYVAPEQPGPSGEGQGAAAGLEFGLYATFGSDMPGECASAPVVETPPATGENIEPDELTGGRWDPAEVQDFILTKENDKSSPKLNEAILAGKCFDEVEIHFCTTVGAEEEVPVYKLKLEKVRVTSYNLIAPSEFDVLSSAQSDADEPGGVASPSPLDMDAAFASFGEDQ